MAEQKRLKGFAIAKGKEYKGELPKQYRHLKHVFIEDKYDGLRGVIIVRKGKAKAYTSSGVLVPNAIHICREFAKAPYTDNRMYDGEFFAKNWNLSQSLVKTQSLKDNNKALRFHVFDCVALSEWDSKKGITPLEKRKHILSRLTLKLNKNGKKKSRVIYMQEIPIAVDKNFHKAVMEHMARANKNKREGSMIKDPTAPYSFKRNADWLKVKPKRESDLKIVGVLLGTEGKKHAKTLGRLKLEGIIDGKKVATRLGSGFTDAQRAKYWAMYKKGKLIGKVVTVEHEGLTKKNALRFPEFLRFHAEK